jgi:hypothetical protein
MPSTALAVSALTPVGKGLRWGRPLFRHGEEDRQRHFERRGEAVKQVQRRVTLLALKLAQPPSSHARIHGKPFLGQPTSRPKMSKIPSQKFPSAHQGEGALPPPIKPLSRENSLRAQHLRLSSHELKWLLEPAARTPFHPSCYWPRRLQSVRSHPIFSDTEPDHDPPVSPNPHSRHTRRRG